MSVRNLFLLVLLFLKGCIANNGKDNFERNLETVKTKSYSIVDLPYLEKPYIREDYISTTLIDFDQDSIPISIIDGQPYYHPVVASLYGIRFVDGFVRSGDPYYLDLAERIANKLVEKSEIANSDYLFPYNFDFSYSAEDNFISPWYSGMAQGRLLTFFSRLYDITGKDKYLTLANKTFNSFKFIEGQDDNWIGYIDEENYYWIEEYPAENPIHVLNGFIYSIYGLYEYYITTNEEESLKLLNAALTTIEDHMNEYRNPGGISFYDLKNKHSQERYHAIHIDQLRMLSKITGKTSFKKKAEEFASDF